MRFRFITVLATVLTLSAGVAVTGAQAQSDGSSKGIFGGLFNNGGSSGGGGNPIFINRNKQGMTGGNAGASRTGVARSTSRQGSINYRVVPNKPQDEMTVGELIQQSTAEQNAKTDAYVARKKQEAEEMAAQYKQEMRERLAVQSNNPSAQQSMGAGGASSVSREPVKRRMIYKQDNDDVSAGKKPIRLFDVR